MVSQPLWLQSYKPNTPPTIDLNRYSFIGDVLEKAFKTYSDKPAFSCMGKTLTYQEIDRKSLVLAFYFQDVLGLKKGDRIGVMMPNVLQYPLVIYGALRAGLVVVNINPLYTPRELLHQLQDSGAETLVILENFAHTFAQIAKDSPVTKVLMTGLGDLLSFPKSLVVNLVVRHIKKLVPPYQIPFQTHSMKEALGFEPKPSAKLPVLSGGDLAFLQYTGGTTGVSKGAMLSHRNIISNLLQAEAWLKDEVVLGQEIIVTALPLYHIFSLVANCLAFTHFGGHNILITNPRDMKAFVKELGRYPFTAITGVNTLFNALLHNEAFQKLNFSTLKVSLGGGMAVQKPVADLWKKITGKPLVQAYGLTETSPAVCINLFEDREFTGSIGLPLPSTLVSIRDEADQELPPGTPGELCVKGPQVMEGYWGQPEETKKSFSKSGWLLTGDVGVMDQQGFFKIVDRKKDMIIVSGFNVYPNEIEEVVASHPGILEAAAVGIVDEKSGEKIKIFAVKKDPNLTAEDLIDHCRKSLTGYKVPKQVEFRDELPKSNVGKILRRSLREAPRAGG
jgi:long-chain acyl-CoA synthetase